MIIELSMSEADREALGGPEWVQLDTERVLDTPASTLIRWEAECTYPIERAMADMHNATPPAASTLVLLWLARKQGGDLSGGQLDDGRPEPYLRLTTVRTLQVRLRRASVAQTTEDADDAVPPASTPAP